MLTEAQARILHHLSNYPPSLEKAWDLPRDLSLPGIAENLGLVRSALNSPLAVLQERGLVSVRMAHVIGSGSRRRRVHHITQQGLKELESAAVEFGKKIEKKRKKSGNIHGDYPKLGAIFGRKKDVDYIQSKLEQKLSVIISGIAGIGKSTIARQVSENLRDKGHTIHWANSNMFTDVIGLTNSWNFFSDSVMPNEIDNILESLKNKSKTLLVLDDLDQTHPRHVGELETFLQRLSEYPGISVMMCGRTPLPFESGYEHIVLDSIDTKSASKILGDAFDQKQKQRILQMVGGHPLALKLCVDEGKMGEEESTLKEFVEGVILQGLSKEGFNCLDELSIMPTKISANELMNYEMISELDEFGLLRWDKSSMKCELHHLIRNIRKETLSEQDMNDVLTKSAKWWAEKQNSESDLLSLHFSVESGNIDSIDFSRSEVNDLVFDQNSGLSVIIDNALSRNDDNEELNRLAVVVALERGEIEVAEQYIKKIDSSQAMDLAHEITILRGDKFQTETSLQKLISNSSPRRAAQLAITAASNIIDDRLSLNDSSRVNYNFSKLFDNIEFEKLSPDIRQSCILSMNIIRHSASLIDQKFSKAKEYRDNLESLSDKDDIILKRLQLRSDISQMSTQTKSELQNMLDSYLTSESSKLHAMSMKLSFIERLVVINHEDAENNFSEFEYEDLEAMKTKAATKLKARWWVIKSIYSENEIIGLREAASLYRKAGCHKASKELGKRIHELLSS